MQNLTENDLRQFTGDLVRYRHSLNRKVIYTPGVQHVAKTAGAYHRLFIQLRVLSTGKMVCDPACGSGRQLLAVSKHQPHWEFTGQDVDHRATQMTAITLAFSCYRV